MLCLLYLYVCVCVCFPQNEKQGKIEFVSASLPVTKGTHSRFPVLVAGFVESQCRHLDGFSGESAHVLLTMGLLGLSSHASLPWGPHDLCVLASPLSSISILFSITLPAFFFFFFFLSLSPNRHYASIPIKLGVFAIGWTHSHVH